MGVGLPPKCVPPRNYILATPLIATLFLMHVWSVLISKQIMTQVCNVDFPSCQGIEFQGKERKAKHSSTIVLLFDMRKEGTITIVLKNQTSEIRRPECLHISSQFA